MVIAYTNNNPKAARIAPNKLKINRNFVSKLPRNEGLGDLSFSQPSSVL